MRSHLTVHRPWVFASPLLLSRVAWAARGTAFRGQWSLADLIGALVIVGLLGGLMAFVFWPRRPS